MLAAKFTQDTPLPQVGSIGYLRGTGQRARVLRRESGPDKTLLVQLFDRIPATRTHGAFWAPATGSSGNTRVAEADLYPTEEAAHRCEALPKADPGRKPRRGRRAAR